MEGFETTNFYIERNLDNFNMQNKYDSESSPAWVIINFCIVTNKNISMKFVISNFVLKVTKVQIKFVAFWNNLYTDMFGQGIREAYQGFDSYFIVYFT